MAIKDNGVRWIGGKVKRPKKKKLLIYNQHTKTFIFHEVV